MHSLHWHAIKDKHVNLHIHISMTIESLIDGTGGAVTSILIRSPSGQNCLFFIGRGTMGCPECTQNLNWVCVWRYWRNALTTWRRRSPGVRLSQTLTLSTLLTKNRLYGRNATTSYSTTSFFYLITVSLIIIIVTIFVNSLCWTL